MHHLAKCSQNQSKCCGDMAIFSFFKMATVHHLGFVWRILVPLLRVLGGLYHLSECGWNPVVFIK